MRKTWTDYDPQFVRRRYNKLAPFYTVFEYVFLLPPGIRARAVRTMNLNPGASVLEVGCGSGRNLKQLVNAVGPTGKVYGADNVIRRHSSESMTKGRWMRPLPG